MVTTLAETEVMMQGLVGHWQAELTKTHCFPDSTESYYCAHRRLTPGKDEITLSLILRNQLSKKSLQLWGQALSPGKENIAGQLGSFHNWKGLALSVEVIVDPLFSLFTRP